MSNYCDRKALGIFDFTVATDCDVKEGTITQVVCSFDPVDNTMTLISHWLSSTKETHIRKALIDLGWTPPEGKENK